MTGGAGYTGSVWLPPSRQQPKTIADWLALPEGHRFELIDGELIEKAGPAFEHGLAQRNVSGAIGERYNRPPGGPRGPGGWWIVTEVDIALGSGIFRPDIAGWRRERLRDVPQARILEVRPDWICEIVSDSNRTTDTVKKLRRYHEAGVPHYWILDQRDRTLTVYRHAGDGYLIALAAEEEDRVRPEPFSDIEVSVAVLLGADED